jgi:transposase-like protein
MCYESLTAQPGQEGLSMKRKRHTPEQIIAKLREAETERANGSTVAQVCKKLGVSEQTYQRWRQIYSGMQPDQLKRLKALERENSRLKKLVAEQAMDIDVLKEVASKSGGSGAGESRILGAACLPVVAPAPIDAALRVARARR